MQDDDFATNSQSLVYAMEAVLGDEKIKAHLSPTELLGLQLHLEQVRRLLQYYRAMNSFTERQTGQRGQSPVVLQPGMSMVGLLSAVAIRAPAIPALASGGSLLGAASLVGTVLLPIAGAVLLSELTGGSLQAIAGKKLLAAVEVLRADLIVLGATTSMMSITAAVAAALTVDQLIAEIKKAIQSRAISVLSVLFAELILRVPACAGLVTSFQSAINRYLKAKTVLGPAKSGSMAYPRAIQEYKNAHAEMEKTFGALLACIRTANR